MATEGTKKILLLIEDENMLLNLLREKFSGEGYEVLTARDGNAGLEVAVNNKPDLIVLDLLLPGLDGMELLKQLRSHPEGQSIKVVVLSNLDDEQNVRRAVQLGANDYLVKADVSLESVVNEVRSLLG